MLVKDAVYLNLQKVNVIRHIFAVHGPFFLWIAKQTLFKAGSEVCAVCAHWTTLVEMDIKE